jgi:hypothetical protein
MKLASGPEANDSADHDWNMLGHADRGNDAVNGENKVKKNDLASCDWKGRAVRPRDLGSLDRIDGVMNLCRCLEDEEEPPKMRIRSR